MSFKGIGEGESIGVTHPGRDILQSIGGVKKEFGAFLHAHADNLAHGTHLEKILYEPGEMPG